MSAQKLTVADVGAKVSPEVLILEAPPVNYSPAVAASLLRNPVGTPANAAFVVTAVTPGAAGNSLRFILEHSSGIFVTVDGNDIACDVDTGVSTAQQIIDAVNADPVANQLVVLSLAAGHDGSGAPYPESPENLTGGTDSVSGTAGRSGQFALVADEYLHVCLTPSPALWARIVTSDQQVL